MSLGDLENFDVWVSYHYSRISVFILQLGFWVSKGPADRKSPRQHSDRPHNVVNVIIFLSPRLRLSLHIGSCGCLVYWPSSCYDSIVLFSIRWLVILTKCLSCLSSIHWQDRSAVTHIGYVAHVPNYHWDYRARAWSLYNHQLPVLISSLAHGNEGFFGFFESFQDSFFGVPREALFLDDEVVKIVSQILCTGIASMPIVDSKEWALRPTFMLPVFWLHYVQNDGNSIFIVGPDKSLVGVGSVSSHNAIPFHAALGWLMIRNYNPNSRLQW